MDGNLAEVELNLSANCGHACSCCVGSAAAGKEKAAGVTAVNLAGARAGDTVTVKCERSRLVPALLIFIVPFACFFAGYFLSGVFTASETARNISAGAGFLLGAAPAVLRDRKLRRSKHVSFLITKIAGT